MKLDCEGNISFATIKEIVDFIRQLDEVECERADDWLREIALSYNCIKDPVVNDDDGAISVEAGDLDDDCLWDRMLEFKEREHNGDVPDGIVLYVKVGSFEFSKDGRESAWRCSNIEKLRELPLGYTDKEFEDEVYASDSVQDGFDLISEALDKAVDLDEQFSYDYRMFRSLGDDLLSIESGLEALPYDGFYAHEFEYQAIDGTFRLGHRIYGLRKERGVPYTGFSSEDLIPTELAARYLAESIGLIEAKIIHKT